MYYKPKSKCTKDCAPGGPLDGNNDCGGIIEDAWIDLYDTTHECCQQKISWQDPDLCASQSDPSSAGTTKFFVIYEEEKCGQDCDAAGGLPCVGRPQVLSVQLFDSAADCCSAMLPWLDLDSCLSVTNGVPISPPALAGSGEWYVDWAINKCVKDCVGAAPCGGLKDGWEFGHASVDTCCAMISWVPRSSCHI